MKLVFEVINACTAPILMAPCPFAGCLDPNRCVRVANLAEPGGVGYTWRHSPAVITDAETSAGEVTLDETPSPFFLSFFFFLPSAGIVQLP